MAQEWTIRPYRDGDEKGILSLFNAVFTEIDPAFTPRTLDHWHWAFRDHPMSHHSFVAEDPSGKVIGNYSAVPGTWLYKGDPFTGSQAVDSCVDRAYRRVLKREGLFLSLAGAWFDHWGRPERDRIVYGFPNPAAFRIGTKRLDYRPVHTPVPSYNRNFGQDWIDWLGELGANQVEVREVEQFDPAAVELFDRHHRDLGLVQRRDLAFLDWRYSRCPSWRYRILEARSPGDQTLRGVLVVRAEWPGREVAPLVDFLIDPTDRAALAALVREAANIASGTGRHCLEAWAPPWSAHARLFEEVGFAQDDSSFNLCIRVFGPPFDEHWAREHWYYTMGDADVV